MDYSNYILLNNITNENNGTMTLLKTIDKYTNDSFFQIVRCNFESEKKVNLTIGNNISISNPDNQPIRSEGFYTILDLSFGNIKINVRDLNICITLRKNTDDEDDCFNS